MLLVQDPFQIFGACALMRVCAFAVICIKAVSMAMLM